ncbi:MAG TPA: ATP-binding protein [Polyangiaceae bacterium]|nr:ATP-binding protein [Polyangiaceae bacterium]
MSDTQQNTLRVRGALLERRDIARLLQGVLLTIAIASAASAWVSVHYGDHAGLIGSTVGLLAAPLLWVILRRGREALAALGTAVLLLAVAVFVVTQGDGLLDVGMLIFPGVIVVSGLLLEQRFSLLMSVLTIVSAVAVGVADNQGWLTDAVHRAPLRDVLNAGIVLAALAFFVGILTNALYRGLHRAYRTEQARIGIFNAVAEGIAIFDASSGKLIDINDAAIRILGLSSDQVSGCEIGILAPASTEAQHKNQAVLQQVPAEHGGIVNWQRPVSQGQPLRAEVALKRVTLGGEPCIIAVARDVTEQSLLREQIGESQQLRAVGQLAGGIAHDFNNQLTGIMASASMLELTLPADSKQRGHVEMILRCATRSADLTRELLAFARHDKAPRRPIECRALIEDVLALLRRSIDKRIIIEQRVPTEALYTLGDPSLLENALLNLALNARDAMPSGGRLRIQIKPLRVDPGPRPASIPANLGPGEYIQLAVSDTGFGMDAQTRARVFEPFFTTKAKGHGMGLAAVYGTLQAHGGGVSVESAPGEGSTFALFLPRCDPPTDAERESVVTKLVHPSAQEFAGARVLLGEDEPDVAGVIASSLEQMGIAVETCADGQAALNRFKQSPDAFDLVILDQMMPQLSGAQVLGLVRAERASIPVLITSGYTGEDDTVPLTRADEFLRKPFGVEEVQAVVRKLLRRKLRRVKA